MTKTVDMSPERVASVIAQAPKGGPILMLNLLKFRDKAAYSEDAGVSPCSGREAYYERYAPVATRLVTAEGAKVHTYGKAMGSFIAPPEETWDELLLVQYPDLATTGRVFSMPEYQAIVFHRTAALEDSRLIPFMPTAIDL